MPPGHLCHLCNAYLAHLGVPHPRTCDMTSQAPIITTCELPISYNPDSLPDRLTSEVTTSIPFSQIKMVVPKIQIAAVVASAKTSVSSRVEIKCDRLVPTPTMGEILVKLEFSGVCHSDVHSIRGETPMSTDVAGHEGIGRVVEGMVHV